MASDPGSGSHEPMNPHRPHPAGEPQALVALVRSWTWGPWLVVGLVVVRVLAVIGLRPYVYVDSAEYRVLDFSGGSRRPWATPLLYRLVPGDDRWQIVAQAVVGGIAWAVLALAVAAWFRRPVIRLVVAGSVTALAVTTSVTNWDTAMLSESLALSLTALVVAAWLNLARRPNWATATLVLVATLPWLFVRQSLMPAAWLAVVAVGVAAIVTARRGGAGRQLVALTAGLILLCGLASVSYGRNQEVVQTNLTVIVSNRIAPHAGRLAWFRDHSMPVPPSGDLGPASLSADPAFSRWVRGPGRGTYVRYLLTHPWYSLTEPLDDLVGIRRSYGDEPRPQSTMLSPSDGYGSARPVIPELMEQALFQPGATGAVLAALGALGGLILVRWERRRRGWAVPLIVISISLASLLIGWHGATPELGRLAIVAAVGLRLGLIVQFGFLIDDELRRRATAVRSSEADAAVAHSPVR